LVILEVKLERSNVEFPLWRKKVDKSILEHNGTTIPLWACQMWGLQELFGEERGRISTLDLMKTAIIVDPHDLLHVVAKEEERCGIKHLY